MWEADMKGLNIQTQGSSDESVIEKAIDKNQEKTAVRMRIPYVSGRLLINGEGAVLSFGDAFSSYPITDAQRHILERILQGGWTTQDIAKSFLSAWQTDSSRTQSMIMTFLAQLPFIRVAEIDVPPQVDGVILDRGLGGVPQHALDLWERLNKRYRVLLISAGEPIYGFDETLSHLIITPQRCRIGEVSFMAFISLVRTIVKKLRCRLLLFTHYAMTPFFFDVAPDQPSITFGDAYGESTLAVGRHLAPDPIEKNLPLFWQEVFYGAEEPWLSMAVAKAYYWTFKEATENWFWTESQLEAAQSYLPDLSQKFRLVLPLIDTDALVPSHCDPPDSWLLFTTTSPNVGRRGLDPLLRVFERLPENTKLRLVLKDMDYAPHELRQWGSRIQVLAKVPKAEMSNIYRSCVASCRISSEDTSPLSVLECMACGVPVVVSPVISRNIPVIIDGVTGYVVEPEDTDMLENRLRVLLADPQARRRLGDAGRRAVMNNSLSNSIQVLTRYLGDDTNNGERKQVGSD